MKIFCSKCGTKVEEGAKFCPICGEPVDKKNQKRQRYPVPGRKKRGLLVMGMAAACLIGVFVFVVGLNIVNMGMNKKSDASRIETAIEEPDSVQQSEQAPEEEIRKEIAVKRPSVIGTFEKMTDCSVKADVEPYRVDADFGNVINKDRFIQDTNAKQAKLLAENLFYVTSGYNREFYETYENNRYMVLPSFVTVDSMMHTYHLYFSYLMKKTEREYLADALSSVSGEMLEESLKQYEELKGTEWESASLRNVAFFAVGAYLQDDDTEIPDEVSAVAAEEISRIMDASGIDQSEITESLLDYSQFLPRGYYGGDEDLEEYFRAMMWYGQIGFLQKREDLDRSALLMTLAMEKDAFSQWETIYVVTSFFAGASDDLTCYEYLPAIEAAYGKERKLSSLVGNEEGWKAFRRMTDEMEVPAINSIPTINDYHSNTVTSEENKGFRFMGQRFTIDAAVFQKLICANVRENSKGEKRMLPDVLDVASALGSETAYTILDEQGDTDFANYKENMEELRTGINNAPETLWSASLYANWLYTLKPLLEKKGEGYPDFMRSTQWEKKNLESFAGSYTELKHDTVLYAKQVMAEMGGDNLEKKDDRGYVEPEIQVWSRFEQLSAKTAKGLKSYGILGEEDETNLKRLEEMAHQFLVISRKELENTLLTDEEYELIRNYGGNLEHFWLETLQDESDHIQSGDFPAAIVTDIATDPNGTCLEVGTGNPSTMYVIVPVEGKLRICVGAVYSFYQFEQPINDRLTDSEWRQMMGIAVTDQGMYNQDTAVDPPEWTQSYRYEYE